MNAKERLLGQVAELKEQASAARERARRVESSSKRVSERLELQASNLEVLAAALLKNVEQLEEELVAPLATGT